MLIYFIFALFCLLKKCKELCHPLNAEVCLTSHKSRTIAFTETSFHQAREKSEDVLGQC